MRGQHFRELHGRCYLINELDRVHWISSIRPCTHPRTDHHHSYRTVSSRLRGPFWRVWWISKRQPTKNSRFLEIKSFWKPWTLQRVSDDAKKWDVSIRVFLTMVDWERHTPQYNCMETWLKMKNRTHNIINSSRFSLAEHVCISAKFCWKHRTVCCSCS